MLMECNFLQTEIEILLNKTNTTNCYQIKLVVKISCIQLKWLRPLGVVRRTLGSNGPRTHRKHRCAPGQANSLLMSQHSFCFFVLSDWIILKLMPLSEFCCCIVVSIFPVVRILLHPSINNTDFLYIVSN